MIFEDEFSDKRFVTIFNFDYNFTIRWGHQNPELRHEEVDPDRHFHLLDWRSRREVRQHRRRIRLLVSVSKNVLLHRVSKLASWNY